MGVQAEQKIQKLRETLTWHNYHYHELNCPVISDYEFDMMLLELKLLEEEHPEYYHKDSPTQVVGWSAESVFNNEVE